MVPVDIERFDVEERYGTYLFAINPWFDIEEAPQIAIERQFDVEAPSTFDVEATPKLEVHTDVDDYHC